MLPVGITTTRIVNFINDELWGNVCHPDRPWCIQFPGASTGYRHPSQIYEAHPRHPRAADSAAGSTAGSPTDGVVAWTWFTLYGITRSVAELWRQADFTVHRAHRRPALRAADDRHRRLRCCTSPKLRHTIRSAGTERNHGEPSSRRRSPWHSPSRSASAWRCSARASIASPKRQAGPPAPLRFSASPKRSPARRFLPPSMPV